MLRRKVKHFGLSKPHGVGVAVEAVTSQEILEDGTIRNRVSVQEIPLDEVDEKLQVITPDDYKLENLMKAGVPLDQINLSGFMAPTDKAVVADIADANALRAYTSLREEEDRIADAKAKSVKTEQVKENAE